MLFLRRLWCPLPLSASVACVAVHCIQVATTAQLVRTQESERRSTHVQRGRGESDYTCASRLWTCPRAGADNCRLEVAPLVPRRSACDGHDDGVPSGRFSAPAMRNRRWGCHGPVVVAFEVRVRTRPSRSSTRWRTLRCGTSQRTSGKSRPRG